MKSKLKPMLSLLLGVAFAFGMNSCSDEREVSGLRSSDLVGDYPVSINLRGITTAEPKTYGSVSAETFESNLTTTHALIFSEEGKYLGIRPVAVTDVQAAGDATHDTKAKATFDLGTSLGSDGKTVKFVLVGNLNTSDFETNIQKLRESKSKTSINELTLEDIKMLRITQASDAKDHFVMLGKPQDGGVASVTVKRNIAQEYPGIIDMERLSARIDVKIGGGTNNAGLSVTGVKLMKKQGHSYLYEKGGNPSGASLTSGEEASAMYTEAPFEKKIYTYENSVAEATYVEVSLALNGVALKPVIVPFTGKAIERNHIYTVSLDRDPADNPNIDPNLNQPRITFKVDVNDWNVDYRYIEDYVDDSVPVIVKTTRYNDENFSTPDYVAPLHTYDQVDNIIHITSLDMYYMLIDVESKSTQSVGEVIEGRDWMTLSDATTYSGMRQQYRLSLTHFGNPTRVGKIEFRNKLNPERKLTVMVVQASRKPRFIAPDKPQGLKLPLEYVAEYNVNTEGDNFATSHANNASGLFGFGEDNNIMQKLSKHEVFANYHIPTKSELTSIIPNHLDLRGPSTQTDVEDFVNIGSGLQLTGITADYKSVSKQYYPYNVTYALRCKGSDMLSAWRYRYMYNSEGGGNMLEVRCLYLGKDFKGTIEDITDEVSWELASPNAVVRYFPASGIKRDASSVTDVGSMGSYLSSTIATEIVAPAPHQFTMEFRSNGTSYGDTDGSVGHAIRLFAGPRVSSHTPVKPENVKLPLEYLAEYDVNRAGTGFATDYSVAQTGYFEFTESPSFFTAPALKGYHIPTASEWRSIVYYLFGHNGMSYDHVEEKNIEVTGAGKKTYSSIYYGSPVNPTPPIMYAVRYKGHGDTLYSAWRYKREIPGTKSEFGGWTVQCLYLGPNSEFLIYDIMNDSFWLRNADKIIERYIPFVGDWKLGADPDQGFLYNESRTNYISVSRASAEEFYSMDWHLYDVLSRQMSISGYKYPVRLFSDK